MIPQNETLVHDLMYPINTKGSHHNFANLIERIVKITEDAARKTLKAFLERMDYEFRISENRKKQYYVKDTRERTIITIVGEVTYIRTIYVDKYNNKIRYCYVDEKLGIDKWIHYTNDVASYAYEAYSEENSMIKVGQELGRLIFSKFSLNPENIDYSISRQTIYNMLHRVNTVRFNVNNDNKAQIEDLYVLLDEKYIASQKKDDSKIMVKSALICEGLDKSKNRHTYMKPYYFSSYTSDFASELLNIIDNKYDVSYLKRIHVLSDSGSWIKGVIKDLTFTNVETISYTDRYHFSKYIWKITNDNDKYALVVDYLVNGTKEELLELLEAIDSNKLHIEDIKYIKNNYDGIQNMLYLSDMNCAMEQVISHHIASQFTSVPKAYSRNLIESYLSMRDNVRNNINMKYLFFTALDNKYNKSNSIVLSNHSYDLSSLDKEYNETHNYTLTAQTGKRLKWSYL